MAFVPKLDTTTTVQGERTDDLARSSSSQNQRTVQTPGVDTTTENVGEAVDVTVTAASTATTKTVESAPVRTTTETAGPKVSRTISEAYQTITMQAPQRQETVQKEDAVFTVKFVLDIQDLHSLNTSC